MSKLHGSVSSQELVRLRAGDLILRGFDNDEIMETLEVSLSSVQRWRTVQRWRKKVENEGLNALVRKPGSGAESKLTSKQLEELKTILKQGAIASGYQTDRWTSRIVADLIFKKWKVSYNRNYVRQLLHDLGFSYQKPTTKSKKHCPAAVKRWRKHDWTRIKKK
jgi:transposase